jgi:hypothetical protein
VLLQLALDGIGVDEQHLVMPLAAGLALSKNHSVIPSWSRSKAILPAAAMRGFTGCGSSDVDRDCREVSVSSALA